MKQIPSSSHERAQARRVISPPGNNSGGKQRAPSDVWLAVRKGFGLLASGEIIRRPSLIRRALKKARWLILKHLGIDEVVLRFQGGMRLCAPTSDNVIACDVYLDGQFGYEQFDRALRYLNETQFFVDRQPVFVDVGANIGTHTLYAMASGRFERVVSVEPEPINFEFLLRNLRINAFDTRHAINVGLSDRVASAVLAISNDNSGDHRIVHQSREGSVRSGCATKQVALIDFSSLTQQLQLQSSDEFLFWIDTQGHELEVLRGINASVLRGNAFVVEFWPSLLRANGALDDFMQLVKGSASHFLVLESGYAVTGIEQIDALAEFLLPKPYPGDQLDVLFIGSTALPPGSAQAQQSHC